MGASSSTAKEPAAVPSPSAAGEAVTVATRAAVGAAGAAVGSNTPESTTCSNTPESTTGGFGAYIQKQLALGAAEDLKRQAPGATQGGKASFGFRPTGCCATPYCAPTFAPLSLTNPACLVGQHVSLLTGEKYHCGSCFPLETGPCQRCNRLCARRVCRMGTKGWAVCACFSWLDFLPCCSCPPVGKQGGKAVATAGTSPRKAADHTKDQTICVAALATYFLRQSLVSTYDIELGPEKGFGTDRMGVGTPSAWYCCLLTQQVAFLEEVTDKDARMRAEDDARLASSRKSDSDSAAAAGGKQAGEAVVGSSADKAAADTAPQQEQPMQSTSKAD